MEARLAWDANPEPDIAGYKVHLGTISGQYTRTLDAGNTTEALLGDLQEGTTYYAALTAYNQAGFESDYSEEFPFIFEQSFAAPQEGPSVGHLVSIEAESGTLVSPMVVASDASTSWVQSQGHSASAAAQLSFNLPFSSGCYVWCRVQAPTNANDSFFVSINGQPEFVYHVYGEASPPASVFSPGWRWSRIEISPGSPHVFSLTSGTHTLNFRFREHTPLDRVVVVTDPDFIPDDQLPRSGPIIRVVSPPTNRTAPLGTPAKFEARLVSNTPLALGWKRNGTTLLGVSGNTLSIPNTRLYDAGNYTLQVWSSDELLIGLQARLNVLAPPGTPAFGIQRMTRSSSGLLVFEVTGESGSPVTLQVSDDLLTWTTLATFPETPGNISIVDPLAAVRSKRFYRLQQVNP